MATVTMTKTNIQWDICLRNLQAFLSRSDLVGYISARNSRKILDALKEYHEKQEELIKKYGKDILDDEGNPTGQIGIPVEDVIAFNQFKQAMHDYSNVEQQIDILMLCYDDVQGVLTGEEILQIDFMCID